MGAAPSPAWARARPRTGAPASAGSSPTARSPAAGAPCSENFPEVRGVSLAAEPSCHGLDGVAEDGLKVAAAMALELRKGERSFYFPYLSTLPTLDDYRAFLPRLASDAVAAEFSALPIMKDIRDQQNEDRAAQQCFEAWQRQPQSLVSDVTWDDVYGALLNYHLRACRAQKNGDRTVSHAMIPLFDFINTGRSKILNTEWVAVRKDQEFTAMLAKGVEAGGELLENYCNDCLNDDMLLRWGVYLEDNENRFPRDRVIVEAWGTSCGEAGGDELARMERMVAARLDVAGAEAGWASPRCLPSALAQEQGPLRCSLARLAWEQCVATRGGASGP